MQTDDQTHTYIGGLSWRGYATATWPFAKLVVTPHGLSVGPSSRWLRWMWKLCLLPTLQVTWSDVERVRVTRGRFGAGAAVEFRIERKTLRVFSTFLDEVIDDAAQYVPDRVDRSAPS